MKVFVVSALVGMGAALMAAPSVRSTVPTRSSGAGGTSRSAVVMRTGSQVAYRIRRKRIQNQERGRLRLNIFRSNNNIYAQVIDDVEGHTLAACSTLDPIIKEQIQTGATKTSAAVVGARLAEILKEKGINDLYYDRYSGSHKYLFHGRIKALVDGVREGGINI